MRTNVLSSLLATSLLFWSAPTAAVGNLSPSSMNDWDGRAYNKTAAIQQGYDIVVKQLGMAIANHPQSVTSMGLHGFEMSVQNTVSFIDAARYADGSPSPWNLAFSNEEAPENLWIPAIHIKKALLLRSVDELAWFKAILDLYLGPMCDTLPLKATPKFQISVFSLDTPDTSEMQI